MPIRIGSQTKFATVGRGSHCREFGLGFSSGCFGAVTTAIEAPPVFSFSFEDEETKYRYSDGLFHFLITVSLRGKIWSQGFSSGCFGAVTTAIDAPLVFSFSVEDEKTKYRYSDGLFHFLITVSLRGKGCMDRRAFPFSNYCFATQ